MLLLKMGGAWAAALALLVGCTTGTSGTGVEVEASVEDGSKVSDASLDAVDAAADVVDEPDVALEASDEPDVQADASDGASACNAKTCGGACCGDQCIPRDCSHCSIGSLFCPFMTGIPSVNGVCVSDCMACNPGGSSVHVACFSCSGGVAAGQCVTGSDQCSSGIDAGSCGCASGDAGECPGATEVCSGGACLTCGQPGTDGAPCANGGACSAATASCGP